MAPQRVSRLLKTQMLVKLKKPQSLIYEDDEVLDCFRSFGLPLLDKSFDPLDGISTNTPQL
jgi:hypothetical protein